LDKKVFHIPTISTLSFITDNIKAARKSAKMNQDQVAERLGVPRSTYANWEAGANIDHDTIAAIGKIIGYKYRELIDESFLEKHQLNEPTPKYKKDRKSVADIKLVDKDVLIMHDLIIAKSMLRVMLRTQAEIIAAQTKQPVKSVLGKMTAAVRAETSEEFDEL